MKPRSIRSVTSSIRAHGLVLLALLVAGAGFGLHGALGPANTDWTIDNAAKSLLVANLRADPSRTWIEYRGESVDPQLRFFPQPLTGSEPYGRVRDGRVVSQYFGPFVWLAFPFVAWFGLAGQSILPAVGGGLAVLVTGRLASRANHGETRTSVTMIAALVLSFSAPLLFYSSVFWEHTLVMVLATGALLALSRTGRSRPGWAGLALGAGVFLREEMVLLFVATIAILALDSDGRRSIPRVVLGASAGLLAVAAFNLRVAGSPFGIHLSANRPSFLVNVPRAIDGLITNPGYSGLPGMLGGIVVLAGLLSRRLRSVAALEIGALTAVATISLLAFLRFPAGEDQALALIHSNSMLVAAPWAVHSLSHLSRRAADRAFHISALFLLFLLLLIPARSITGIHPGPRLLLPIFPVLAIAFARDLAAGFRGREHFARIRTGLLVVLALIGALWSARSLVLLHEKRVAIGRIAAAIDGDPHEVVVTDLFWLPTELPALWNRKTFHLVAGPDDFRELVRRYAERGDSELLMVTSPGSVRGSAPSRIVQNPGFSHFSVELHVQRLAP